MMAGLKKVILAGRLEVNVLIICPREPLPAIETPELMMDLWGNALTGRKWEDLIQEVTHLHEPSLMISTVNDNAVTVSRAFSMFTIGIKDQGTRIRTVSWRPALMETGQDKVIWVDCEVRHSVKTQKALYKVSSPFIKGWEGPTKSPASTSSENRVVFKGLVSRYIADLDIAMLVRGMANVPALSTACIAAQDILNDRGARVMEVTSLQTLDLVKSLCDEVMLIAPKTALIQTREPKETWREVLTQLVRADPNKSVTQVRWRRAEHGGQPWVKPILLDSCARGNLEKARAVAAKCLSSDTRLAMEIGRHMGSEPGLLWEALMKKVGETTGVSLVRLPYTMDPPQGSWVVVPDDDGELSNRAIIEVREAKQVQLFYDMIHGASVVVNGLHQTVVIFGADFEADVNNGGRGAAPTAGWAAPQQP